MHPQNGETKYKQRPYNLIPILDLWCSLLPLLLVVVVATVWLLLRTAALLPNTWMHAQMYMDTRTQLYIDARTRAHLLSSQRTL